MSHPNVERDVHNVRVNMSNDPQRQRFGGVQPAAGSVSSDSYNNLDYQQPGPNTTKRSSRSDAVYVNSAFVGSVNSVNNISLPSYEQPTSVIREQYWACSRWPFTQRALAIAVGVLLGAVFGLILTLTLKKDDTDIRTIFKVSLPPD